MKLKNKTVEITRDEYYRFRAAPHRCGEIRKAEKVPYEEFHMVDNKGRICAILYRYEEIRRSGGCNYVDSFYKVIFNEIN